MVSSPNEIKNLLVKEHTERLRLRPIHPELEEVIKLKDKSFKLKLEHAKAMFNVTKQAERELEQIDEDILRHIFFDTVRGCPIS